MNRYNNKFKVVMEKYGFLKTITRERFPSKLKLSPEFIRSFQEEFKRQTSDTIQENEDGTSSTIPGRNKHTVIKEFQKAVKFLTNGL